MVARFHVGEVPLDSGVSEVPLYSGISEVPLNIAAVVTAIVVMTWYRGTPVRCVPISGSISCPDVGALRFGVRVRVETLKERRFVYVF